MDIWYFFEYFRKWFRERERVLELFYRVSVLLLIWGEICGFYFFIFEMRKIK